MFRLIGIITVTLFLSGLIFCIEKYTGGDFIEQILFKEILTIIATILGLQLATASFLLTSLSNFELKSGSIFFDDARREIKNNLFLLISIFVLSLMILIFNTTNFPSYFLVIKKIFSISVLLISMYAFYEMIQAIFSFESGARSQK